MGQVTELDTLSTFHYAPERGTVSDVWGYESPSGKEYALVAQYSGVSIMDISDPSTPKEASYIKMRSAFLRDIKTWEHYAYVISDEPLGGLLIIDLEQIDNYEVATTFFVGANNELLNGAHNLFIDEKGRAFVFKLTGFNTGYTYILDLKSSPLTPNILSTKSRAIHDGFVKNDTLWAASIREGLEVYAIEKDTLRLINKITTPRGMAHNCWPDDDMHYMYVTEEVPLSNILVYDIANPLDIEYVSGFQIPGDNMPHNVFIKNDYAYVSYYDIGTLVFDVTDPYDVKPVEQYDGHEDFPATSNTLGNFGVYPFFSSGVIASSYTDGFLQLYGEHNLRYKQKITNLTVKNTLTEELIEDYRLTTDTTQYIFTTLFENGERWFVTPEETDIYSWEVSKEGFNTTIVSSNDLKTETPIVYLEPYLLSTPSLDTYDTSIHLFPNPASSMITLKCNQKISTVEIYDISMKKQLVTHSNIITTTGLKAGAYILMVKTVTGETITKTFLKE